MDAESLSKFEKPELIALFLAQAEPIRKLVEQ
jgi:hypothetical protein